MAKFHAVPEIMGDYARLYLDNGKSCEKDHYRRVTPFLTIMCNVRIRFRLKSQCWSVRMGDAMKKTHKIEVFGLNDLLSEEFRNSVPKEFMAAPIHVRCSNFTEIGRRKVQVKQCIVFVTKGSENVFSPPFCARYNKLSQSAHAAVADVFFHRHYRLEKVVQNLKILSFYEKSLDP